MCCFSGVEGLAELSNQPVSQMNHPANLKTCNPNSAEVEFIPPCKNRQFSDSKEDDMVCIVKLKSLFF